MKGGLIGGGVLLLIVLGVPLFVLLGLLSVGLFGLYEPLPPEALIKYLLETVGKPALLAIPLYILLGAVMSKGETARALTDFMQALTGWVPGGLAAATILSCIAFGAISGSSPVTMVAIGSLLYPAMQRAGYPDRLALGAVVVGGSLGILIPPSIPMIVYGIMTRTDIEKLFLASVRPGILAGVGMMVVAIGWGLWAKLPRQPFSPKALAKALVRALPALGLPALVLGGIYGGLYNVTEAAAVAVLYVLLLELVVYRRLRWGVLRDSLAEAATALGSIIAIVLMAALLSYYLVLAELPFWVSEWVAGQALNQIGFLAVVMGVLLLAGMFMDTLSAILVFSPAFLPAAQALGVSPVLLGVLFIITLEIGYITPPVGLNLFVAMGYFHKPMGRVVSASWPFLLVLLIMAGLLVVGVEGVMTQ
jgi:C4-dicarboxylate transporter DctM subunit